jgi:parallel beta-helix repeat protein
MISDYAMKKGLIGGITFVGISVLIGGFFLAGIAAQAEDGDENRIFVDANGPYGGDGSREQPFRDIHSLTETLKEPTNTKTEVWISGSFTEALMLNSEMSGTPEEPLLIKQWDGMPQAFFDMSNHPNASGISTNGASDVTIDGLHATASGDGTGSLPIFVNNSTSVIVRNGKFFGGGESGVCLSFSTNVLLENNIFENNPGNGILIPEVHGATIRNNIIRNNAGEFFTAGIFINASTDIMIEGNKIMDNPSDGIFAPGVTNLTVERNDITGNTGNGISVWSVIGSGKIVNNRIGANGTNGLFLDSRDAATWDVAGNLFVENAVGGAYLKMSPDQVTLNLVNNTFLGNGPYGVSIDHLQSTLNLYNNIFVGEEVAAQIVTNRTDRIASDYNDLFDNTTNIQFAPPQQPWKDWEDWRALGKDVHTSRVNPNFTAEDTCITDGLCVSYHLSSTSPLINVGKRIGRALELDIDGQTRIYNNRTDIGADEYVPTEI